MLTPTQLAALKTELSADPLALGYAAKKAAGFASDIAALLNAKNFTLVGSVPVSVFTGWAAQTRMRAVIEDTATNASTPYYAALRSSALAILDVLHGAATSLDLSSSAVGQANVAMLNGWVQAGALTTANQAALMALATVPASRAEVLWGTGTVVDQSDVSNAW